MNLNNKKSYIINIVAVTLLYIVLQVLMQNNIINRYYQGIIVFICINVIVASSLNLTLGFLGQLALGHAGFMAVGAYSSALLSIGMRGMELPVIMHLGVALLFGGIMSGVIGYLIGLPALRLRGDYLAIITLGFGEIIRVVINNIRFTGGAQGLTGIPRLANFTNAYWITVAVLAILFALIKSRHGRAIMSIREDEIAAEAVGIKTTQYKAIGFTISAFFAGIGGGLFAHYMAYLDPAIFNFMKSVEIVVIVVLGGMGSLTGTILAAGVLTSLPEVLRGFSEYRLLIYSFVLVVMMIFRPQGIFGTAEFSMDSLMHSPKAFLKEVKKEAGGDDDKGGNV
ncbi:branched-chain amino acid ABC transporter permease [Alkalibacter saccharofermentans]|jgi:branched-chain amino acid transport system permease protein|uniref:Amino acid/amide ABC transporter membrane protein 2, HAAT family (TC 3.A.1.4.-) n=1 Tax=Alkalibacter saccharofermentans DSM 14828 TaxID=1120975 RepID=A0A1M4YVG6_9FIRM|nr:branched-chain amino acid ABC transporter permease [Alkalibacter saccharofermentans]SHF09799.1 amino acid/amide ABC transporter membrane protein 2, HAAT family (TC 3.A.1.4.-) [Alkalibacter saccharofermentans DSM 14828]